MVDGVVEAFQGFATLTHGARSFLLIALLDGLIE